MQKLKVYIETGADGTYNAYPAEQLLPFGAIGEGNSVQEAKNDFLSVVEEYRPEYGEQMKDIEITFTYDFSSFLHSYQNRFSLAGLSRITGVAAGQLSHYLNGTRKPSRRTVQKIQDAIVKFGQELAELRFL